MSATRVFTACRTRTENWMRSTYHWLKLSPLNPPMRNICIELSESRNKFPLGVFITTAHIDDVS